MTIARMTYPRHALAVLTLGLPLIGGHLAQFAIGLTDTVMLGWYAATALAALTLASAYYFTFFLFSSGIAWAVMPMVAQFQAQGDTTSIRRAARMGLWLSALVWLCLMPLLWVSGPILIALGQSPELAADAQAYLRIAGFGMLPGLLVMVLKSYLAALERTRVVLLATLASAVANGLGNYALIFGYWGAPELGIAGAAWASVLAQAVALAGIAAYVARALPEHALFQRFWRPDTEMMGRVFRLGLPIGLTTLAEVGLFEATAVMMGWLGTVPLAAHGIALQTASATFMVHLGFANVATIRAGNAAGRGDPGHLSRGARTVLFLSLVTALLTIAAFLTVPEALVSLFLDPADPARDAIVALGASLLAMAAVFQLVDGAQVVAIGQDTRVPMVIAILSYWVVGIPASWFFGFALGWGAVGIWMGLVLGLTCAAVALLVRFWRRALPQVVPRAAISA